MCFYDEQTKTLQDPWHVEDVKYQRPDLTEDQAIEVLAFVAKRFDASIGINWFVIDSAAEYLYPEDEARKNNEDRRTALQHWEKCFRDGTVEDEHAEFIAEVLAKAKEELEP
jgi:hypothetical protein